VRIQYHVEDRAATVGRRGPDAVRVSRRMRTNEANIVSGQLQSRCSYPTSFAGSARRAVEPVKLVLRVERIASPSSPPWLAWHWICNRYLERALFYYPILSRSMPRGGRPPRPSHSARANKTTSQSTRQPLRPQQRPLPQLQSPPPQQQQRPQPVDPWSKHRLNLLPPSLSTNGPLSGPSPSPFLRYGHALSTTATAAGELFLFGGLAHNTLRNDLYVISTQGLSATLLQTSGQVPSPRSGHAIAYIGNSLLIWGGATNAGDRGLYDGSQDNSLYLLNLGTWDLLISRPDSS
jgi:hypothetical protein